MRVFGIPSVSHALPSRYYVFKVLSDNYLKAYLINQGQNVDKIVFPELIKRVKEELLKTNPDLIKQIDKINYFHGVRNKLYHQGDGVKPTDDNLKRYSELSKRVVEEILEINIVAEQKKVSAIIDRGKREIEDRVREINERFVHFQESCGYIVEKYRPHYATREFAMKLEHINNIYHDWDAKDLEDRLEDQKQRLEKFNELTGTKQTNQDLVDFILWDINHLYVLIGLQQTDDEWQERWEEYKKLDKQLFGLLYSWQNSIQSNPPGRDQAQKEYESIVSWLETVDVKVVQWIDKHFENSTRLVYQIMEEI